MYVLHVFPWPAGMIIHCHLKFKGLNDGRDISVLTMNKKIEAQRPYLEYVEQMKRGSKWLIIKLLHM